MTETDAKKLARDILEMSYAADSRGKRYLSETALVRNLVSVFTSESARIACEEPIGADGICHACGWDVNTRSYRKSS